MTAWTLLLAATIAGWVLTILLGLIPEGEGRPLDLRPRAHLSEPQPQQRPYDWAREVPSIPRPPAGRPDTSAPYEPWGLGR